MGITDFESLATKQELYRLALCLNVEFDVMVKMPLWEIRERAFFSGEQVMINRLQNIQDHHYALSLQHSEKPGKDFEDIRSELEKDVMVERLMNPDEKKQRIAAANRAAFERMTGFGPGSVSGSRSAIPLNPPSKGEKNRGAE